MIYHPSQDTWRWEGIQFLIMGDMGNVPCQQPCPYSLPVSGFLPTFPVDLSDARVELTLCEGQAISAPSPGARP